LSVTGLARRQPAQLNPSLDSSFSSISQSPATTIQGIFADPRFPERDPIRPKRPGPSAQRGSAALLTLGIVSPEPLTSATMIYSGCNFQFFGNSRFLSMDGANNVSGTAYGLYVGKSTGHRHAGPQRSADRCPEQFSPARWMERAIFRSFCGSAGLTITASL